MKKTTLAGIEIEYEVTGSGEPLLMISPVFADGFAPLTAIPDLRDRYRLITYHKRGWGGSSHPAAPVRIADHVNDAAALLDHLGIARAHVAGHSSGAVVALQLALERPERVHSLVVLEPSLLCLPQGQAFLGGAGPILAAYERGDHAGALSMFLCAVSGLPWERCRAVLEEHIPGAIAATLRDAPTFFGVELPGLAAHELTAARAAQIRQPTLSLLGGDTGPLWVEVDSMLRDAMPNAQSQSIPGIGHLMHLQQPAPVARAIAGFLARHPIAGDSSP